MADKEKKTFVAYIEWDEVFSTLDKESAGELVQAIFAYQKGRVVEITNPILRSVFNLFKSKMEEDAEKYEKTCESRAISGKKGGSSTNKQSEAKEANASFAKQSEAKEANASFAKQSEAKEANASFAKQSEAKEANASFVKQSEAKESKAKQKTPDNDCDNDCDNDFKREEVVENATASLSKSVQKITKEWNDLSSLGIKAISKVGRDTLRERQLHARLKQYSEEAVLNAISNIRASPFLYGKNRQGWMITFDWFIKPNNFPKVLEGNYKDESPPQPYKPHKRESSFPERDYKTNDYKELEKKLLGL